MIGLIDLLRWGKRSVVIVSALAAISLITYQLSLAEVPKASLPQEARSWEKITGLTGLSNVGRVSAGVFRGAQPEADGYATLKKMGIRTVINLRTTRSEKKDVEAQGMQSFEFPLSVVSDVNAETINKIVDIMNDPAMQPIYVHCRQGQDRTGITIAAYRMKVEGWSLKEAETEMQDYGFNDIWVELKEFIRKYANGIGK